MYDGADNPSTDFATLNSTDYTTPSPQVCSSSDEWSFYPSWRAFNQEYNYGWMSATVGLSVVSVMVDLGSGNEKLINKYAIPEKSAYNNSTFRDWILQGSNTVGCAAGDAKNANGWTDLDTRTYGSIGTIDDPIYLTFSCDTAYRYFRVRVTETVGGISTYRPACQGIRLVAQDTSSGTNAVIEAVPGVIEVAASVAGVSVKIVVSPPAAQVALSGVCVFAAGKDYIPSNPATITITPQIFGHGCTISFDPASVTLSASAILRQFKANNPVVKYRCVLTGAPDGLPDLIIPISSFQVRKRVIE